MNDLSTEDVRDLVYESVNDSVQFNSSITDMSWGEIKEELRQLQGSDVELNWSYSEVQETLLGVNYIVEADDYVLEGEIKGRREAMDYF